MDICSFFSGIEITDKYYIIHTNTADIQVIFVTDEILRIKTAFNKQFLDESYILMTTAWNDRLDPLFANERVKKQPIIPEFTQDEKTLSFITSKLRLLIEKDPLNFILYNSDNQEIYRTIAGNPFTKARSGKITAYSYMNENDNFYGFGEKSGLINKNKSFIRERATDDFAYDVHKTTTLYKHIPFYIRLNCQNKQAVGVFYNNFYESVFNMGSERSCYWDRYSYFQAEDGDIDLFLLGGNTISKVLDNYTLLTGSPALLPKRALGYQGSSMYYAELPKDSDKAISEFIQTVKDKGFPIDGFHLSSGYTSQNEKRCVFTWNKTRFSDPQKFLTEMKNSHTQNVPNVKPGVLLCHPRFEDFVKEDVFIKDSKDNSKYAVAPWWGGNGAFWDYTNKNTRKVWKKYLKENLISLGTDSIWNDNCEYDSLLDQDCKCDFDGKGGTVAELKPIMSTLMCKLAQEAIIENNPNARPYVVCRSGSAGIQKYAQTWCGDNFTSWETLKYNIPIILGMGLSGQPNEGADIGGFAGPAPTEELFVRWVQQGIFQPRFSIHSASYDNTVTEPWMFSNSTSLIREAILLRYRFTPYLYSAEYEASVHGTPIMRALVYDFQDDKETWDESFEFMFGKDILVANVIEEGAVTKQVYLPKGFKWYDWNDNYKCYEGGQTIKIPVDISTIPLFIKEGAIISMAQNQIMSMEADKITSLKLIVAPSHNSETEIYDDDGISNDFKNGIFRKTKITMTQDKFVKLSFSSEGSYTDFVKDVTVEMIAKDRCPFNIFLDTKEIHHYLNRDEFENNTEGWYYSQTKRSVEIKYANPKRDYSLNVSFEKFDLIGIAGNT